MVSASSVDNNECNIVLNVWILIVVCRSNLKQLDEITFGLQRRLLAGHKADEEAQDSESAAPLSTSSAFVTAGSTLPSGSGELHLTLCSSDHAVPHVLASTGDSTTTGDAVTELMHQTLKCTDSHSNYMTDPSHTLPKDYIHTPADADDVDDDISSLPANHTSNLFRDKAQQNLETRASASDDRNIDSLKTAQLLLQQLNEVTACSSQHDAIPVDSSQADCLTAADFDGDDMQEDDTLANIWALRQSARCDDGDSESLDSSALPNEHDKSYVSHQALNDVGSDSDDFYAASHTAGDLGGSGDAVALSELETERKQQPAIGCSSESAETWFIDTQDVRDIDNMAVQAMCRRLQDAGNELLDADEANRDAAGVHSPGRPLSQSSPSSLAQVSPAVHVARKSRSLRRTAVQRREQMYHEQHVGNSSDSGSDDFVASTRLRHRQLQNSHRASRDQPAAANDDSQAPVNGGSSKVAGDEVNDIVRHNQETQTVANKEVEDKTKDEPQNASTDVETAPSANQGSPARNDGITVSDDLLLNGHHSVSGEDMYPSEQ